LDNQQEEGGKPSSIPAEEKNMHVHPFSTTSLRGGGGSVAHARSGILLTGQDGQQEQILCVGYQTCKEMSAEFYS